MTGLIKLTDEEPGTNVTLNNVNQDEIHEGTVREDGVVRNEKGEAFSEGPYEIRNIYGSTDTCITCGAEVVVSNDHDGETYCSNDCFQAAMM